MKYDDLTNKELADIIDLSVRGSNAERNRAMLKDRLIDGITYEKLAENYDLSVRQTQRIIDKSLKQLFKRFKPSF